MVGHRLESTRSCRDTAPRVGRPDRQKRGAGLVAALTRYAGEPPSMDVSQA